MEKFDMSIAMQAMRAAFDNVQSNSSPELQAEQNIMTVTLLMGTNPTMMVTKEGISSLHDQYFLSTAHRDFLLGLQFALFTRLGADTERLTYIANSLAVASTIVSSASQTNQFIPEGMIARTNTPDRVAKILLDNKWLFTLLLMRTSLEIDTKVLAKSK